MNLIRHDLRHAARTLLRSPGFTIVAILTIAIGVGSNTAFFSVVSGVLLKPLPFQEPESLVRVYDGRPGIRGTASPPNFVDWRRDNTVFEEMAAYANTAVALTGTGDAKRVFGAVVTEGFFRTFRITPAMGRPMSPADTVRGQDRVAFLGYGLWQREFGADPDIAGRTVQLDGREFTVTGVMPPGFEYPAGAELWLPLSFTEEEIATQRGAHYLEVIARLAPGVTVDEASKQMAAIARMLELRYPDTNTNSSASVLSLHEALVGDVQPALLILLGAVGFVLLIACANVANLLLARTSGRKRELAVRSAVGAGRGHLVRHVLTESLMLAILGGAAGVGLAVLGIELLLTLPGAGVPRLEETTLDATVLLFALAMSLLTGLLFGLLPAARAGSTSDLGAALKSGGPAVTADRTGGRTRGALVVAQTALAVLLLSGAGLLMKSFIELKRVDPGFNPAGVLTFDMPLPMARYPEPRQAREFFAELNRRIEGLPGVESAAGVFGLPLSGFSYTITVEKLDGGPAYDKPGTERSTQVRVVTPEYFRVMQIPLRAGRTLTENDRAGSQPVVVVNESAAKLLWPGSDPLGHTFELGTRLGVGGERAGGTVVGVVADVRHDGPARAAPPEVFFAHSQFPVDFISMTVRTSVPPQSLIGPIRGQVRALDPELPLEQVSTMEERLSESVAQPRFYMLLLGVFAAAALVLAAIGIYGVMTCSVRNRTSEIGIRRALGAESRDVLRMVLTQAMKLSGGGLILGLFSAVLLMRVLSGLLYGVTATDPLTYFGVALLLAAVAMLASYLPARRAARVDPMVALREE